MRKYDFLNEKAVQSYYFTKSQFDKNAMIVTNFISKLSLNNNNSIMSNLTEQKNEDFTLFVRMNP